MVTRSIGKTGKLVVNPTREEPSLGTGDKEKGPLAGGNMQTALSRAAGKVQGKAPSCRRESRRVCGNIVIWLGFMSSLNISDVLYFPPHPGLFIHIKLQVTYTTISEIFPSLFSSAKEANGGLYKAKCCLDMLD